MSKALWKMPWVWIIVCLVVILLAVLYIYPRQGSYKKTTQTGQLQIHQGLPPGYQTQPVTAGKLPQGFPAELVLYNNAVPSRGEVTNPGSGVTHYITEFTVPGTIAAAYNTYMNGMSGLGWKVGSSEVNPAFMDVVFSKAASSTPTENLEFTATPVASGARVRLDYYTNQK